MRRVHALRGEALALADKPSLKWQNAYGIRDEVKVNAKMYYDDVHDKKLVIDNEKEDKVLVLDYKTRFDKEYIKNILKRLEQVRIKEGVFLTLTIDPSKFNSLKAAYKSLRKGQVKIKAYIANRVGKISTISVLEFTEEGIPHLHLIFLGVKFLRPFKELQKAWQKYTGAIFINVKQIYERFGVQRYVLKYISKAYRGADWDMFDDGFVLAWALNARVFSVYLIGGLRPIITHFPVAAGSFGGSRGGVAPLAVQQWSYLGSFHGILYKKGIYTGAERLNILYSLANTA